MPLEKVHLDDLLSKTSTSLVAETKERAGLELATQREMQEGFMLTELDSHATRWRVATLPAPWGEAVVMKAEEYELFDVTQHPLYAQIGAAHNRVPTPNSVSTHSRA